ncbi:MAG: prealbumin-like fold domain-containing protein [Bacilli bacterium]
MSLDAGTYTLEETIAPAGYKLSSSKVTFTVNSNGTVTVDGKVVDKVIMKNEPFYITISKKWFR